MFLPQPQSVLYCYGQYNNMVAKFKNEGINVCSGPPSDQQIDALAKPSIIIFDDLMYNLNEQFMLDLFTKRSHHQNFTVILLCQDLFAKTLKVPRYILAAFIINTKTIYSINSQYIVLMRAPNAVLNIKSLGTQLFPKQLPFFIDAYRIVLLYTFIFSFNY